ncbi:MAG: hypothetical protein F7B59_03155 [Desulfurococcales archaeon]|nr:hypothetical protein [Desulfurococcales archaeon]
MPKEYMCICTVKCIVHVEAEDPEEAMENAEEEAQLGCEEVEEINECECSEEE